MLWRNINNFLRLLLCFWKDYSCSLCSHSSSSEIASFFPFHFFILKAWEWIEASRCQGWGYFVFLNGIPLGPRRISPSLLSEAVCVVSEAAAEQHSAFLCPVLEAAVLQCSWHFVSPCCFKAIQMLLPGKNYNKETEDYWFNLSSLKRFPSISL